MYYSSPSYYQIGSGLPAFRGSAMQKRYGLGGIFKGITRSVAPKLKQDLAYVGKQALKTGLESLEDVAAGGNLKSSLKRRARQNLYEIFNTKVPIKRKVTEKKIVIKQTPKKKGRRDKLICHRDIFSLKIMSTVSDSKKDHIECFISDTDLFTPAFVQSDIELGRYEDIYPIAELEDNGPIEFVIDNASDFWI